MEGQNWVDQVSTKKAYDWETPKDVKFQVVAYDFGIKHYFASDGSLRNAK